MKVLKVSPDKCIGCRTCEVVCSFSHNGKANPRFSNVTIKPAEKPGLQYPVICNQCEDAACMKACSFKAISRDENGVVVIDHKICKRCKACVKACPFGIMGFNFEKNEMHKCDLCGGDPKCVSFCPTGALLFDEVVSKEGK